MGRMAGISVNLMPNWTNCNILQSNHGLGRLVTVHVQIWSTIGIWAADHKIWGLFYEKLELHP